MLRSIRTRTATSHRLFTNSIIRLDSGEKEMSPGEKLMREGREIHQARVDQITVSKEKIEIMGSYLLIDGRNFLVVTELVGILFYGRFKVQSLPINKMNSIYIVRRL